MVSGIACSPARILERWNTSLPTNAAKVQLRILLPCLFVTNLLFGATVNTNASTECSLEWRRDTGG